MSSSWPSREEMDKIRKIVANMSECSCEDVRIVVSPYRICPLGAHIDHQGGIVSAMTIDKGILLGFVPSGDSQVLLKSEQFNGEVRLRVDELQFPKRNAGDNWSKFANDRSDVYEQCNWESYARGALYALQSGGYSLWQGIVGYISGQKGFHSSGLSSSAAVGVAYLLALENANDLTITPLKNIELDQIVENDYLGLRNGILDQSAILLSKRGCLTCVNCKTKEYRLIPSPLSHGNCEPTLPEACKILLAFSGLRECLTNNPGYNTRVLECQEAARFLLRFHYCWICTVGRLLVVHVMSLTRKRFSVWSAGGNEGLEPLLCNVDPYVYEAYKHKLKSHIARRVEHYFSESKRVLEGFEAWASGNFEKFGRLVSESGQSSIENYECGCEPLIQLYGILIRAPGVFGARFSGAGFRGCCIALVNAYRAMEAISFVRAEYQKVQPLLASQLDHHDAAVLVCEAGSCAYVI